MKFKNLLVEAIASSHTDRLAKALAYLLRHEVTPNTTRYSRWGTAWSALQTLERDRDAETFELSEQEVGLLQEVIQEARIPVAEKGMLLKAMIGADLSEGKPVEKIILV